MAGATFTIMGMSAGEPQGQRVFGPLTISNTAVVGETLSVALSSGDNTYTVPTGSVAVMIIPPANNSTAIKFRTSQNSGDTGLSLNPGSIPFVYAFPSSAPSSVILNAGSSVSALTTIAFI